MIRARLSFLFLLVCCAGLTAIVGCDARTPVPDRDGSSGDAGPRPPAMCTAGMPGFICVGNSSVQCLDDGSQGTMTDCGATGQVCVNGTCSVCRPNAFQCAGNDVQQCSADGSGFTTIATCDPASGTSCNSTTGTCSSPCADAAASNSYIGCEYWPTPTANLVDESFAFAVVVANPQTSPADVTVTRNGMNVASATIQPGQTQTIELPWITEMKVPLNNLMGPARPEPRSSLVRGGAYRLQSTLPVTVYQFSPLEFERAGEFSFTNDASLLLPTHVLTGNYIAVSERTRATSCPGSPGFPPIIPPTDPTYLSIPGFVTIVGASETPVTVNVTFAGAVAPSEDGMVQAGMAGSMQTFTLNQGDVLQLASGDLGETCTPGGTTAGQCGGIDDITHCAVNDSFDLTGTSIQATGPVMVIGGHTCAFLPNNRFACDHLEETIFPLEAWGSDFIVSATESLRGEPNIIRVVSGADGNSLTFDPPVNGPATLSRGQVLEFEAREDFRVNGSGPFLVSQFLVGQNYDGSPGTDGAGDPAMSFAIPTEQFRNSYTFLAPQTFTRSFVNVVAPDGVDVMLDGAPVTATWNSIGGTGMRAARIEITGGQHEITAPMPVGIVVYGYAQFTSYMYPGGLDFEDINPLI